MLEIGNSWWMYLIGIIVTVFVLGGCSFFIIKAYKEARRLNMDPKIIKKTITSSIIFTILPSISILVGIFALAGQLGIPLPWIRLSVIGALHYEGTAAKTALQFLQERGITEPAVQIVTIASVMTIGIISGPLFCLFGFKAYDKKILSKSTEQKDDESKPVETVQAKPKRGFGDVLFSAVFIAMITCLLVWDSVEPFLKNNNLTNGTEKEIIAAIEFFEKKPYLTDKLYLPIVVAVVAFGCMALCEFLEKKCKQKWIADFSLGLSMILGMAAGAVIAIL